jgi:Domain of unknown function (DUF3885)
MAITLGRDWQRKFWASPYRLRFELNQGGSCASQITGSYDRARTLARAALETDRPVGVIAAMPRGSWEDVRTRRGWSGAAAFDTLGKMGVRTDIAEKTWTGPFRQSDDMEGEALFWEQRAVRVTWDEADILLWSNIAQDVAVTPRAPVISKLVDVERAVLVFAYDDRGMDVTALSPEPVTELYRRFDAWLLDHDRPRMSKVFRSNG